MAMASLQDLYVHELRDLYNAEQQLTKALPKMAEAASSEELRQAFTEHLDQTNHQISRLEQIFEQLGTSAKGIKCEAMEGLISEGESMLRETEDPMLRDAALVAAAQRVEHYEIAGYGSARTHARHLGQDQAVKLLQETLDEEKEADAKLTKLAEPEINEQAVS